MYTFTHILSLTHTFSNTHSLTQFLLTGNREQRDRNGRGGEMERREKEGKRGEGPSLHICKALCSRD